MFKSYHDYVCDKTFSMYLRFGVHDYVLKTRVAGDSLNREVSHSYFNKLNGTVSTRWKRRSLQLLRQESLSLIWNPNKAFDHVVQE